MNKININKGRNLMKTMAAVVLVGMSTAGCVDMDLSPNGKPAEGNVWSTPTLAEQTIAGVYNQLYVDYSDVANGWFDIWSSTMDYGIGIAPTFNFLFATNSPSSVKGSSAPWQRFYKGIIKANDVIGNLPTVEGFDETKRSRYISECMFLRCWWYYRLNILYNGVPYYKDPIKDIDEAKLARSTQDEVWGYIVDYTQKKNRGFGNRCLPPDPSGNGLGWNNYIINPQFAESYENRDGSKFNWDDIIPGYNDMGIDKRMVYFLRNNITETERKNAVAAGADMSKYDASGNEERIKKAYENRDPRMAMSVITPYASFLGGVEGTPKEYVMRYPFRSYTTYGDLKTDTSLKFYYLNRKFVGEGLELPNIYSELDLPFIRYADVLLNWAEALNELNDLPGAISKVNEVRERAGAQFLGTNEFTQVTGKTDMHQRIMNERHWELIGEDVIYFDEIRWRTWKDLKFYKDKEGKMNGMTQIWGTRTNNYAWGGDHYWSLPIPAREMQMNPNMVQNPGWD